MKQIWIQNAGPHVRSFGDLVVWESQLTDGILFMVNGERARLTPAEAVDLQIALTAHLVQKGAV